MRDLGMMSVPRTEVRWVMWCCMWTGGSRFLLLYRRADEMLILGGSDTAPRQDAPSRRPPRSHGLARQRAPINARGKREELV